MRIHDQIDSTVIADMDTVPDDPKVSDAKILSEFKPLSEADILALIQKSSEKTCNLDPMPTKFVLESLDHLLPVITKMINSSLLWGHFPKVWKEALIDPRYKKAAINYFTNLRPVSNLQYVSKLVERAVFDQVHAHLSEHDLYPLLQSAYRRGHSTETALLKIYNDMLMAMNRQEVVLLVLLDLSAAFDTVEHSVLLSRLSTSFGIRGRALEWFASYLSGRSQRVSLSGKCAESLQLNQGVPHGSCLGPLLFTLYASRHLPSVNAYADDTQLYLALKPGCASSTEDAAAAMEGCINEIRAWMLCDKLKINDDKTEFVIIGTRQQLSKVHVDSFAVGDAQVSLVQSVKNLGTSIDSNMSLQVNINNICKATYYYITNVRRIRKYLSNQATQTLCHALIIGRIDYCNSILYGLPAKQIAKLQRLQNSAARLIFKIPRFYHISPILCTLLWLPAELRIHFKIVIITFKAIHGQAPVYLQDHKTSLAKGRKGVTI